MKADTFSDRLAYPISHMYVVLTYLVDVFRVFLVVRINRNVIASKTDVAVFVYINKMRKNLHISPYKIMGSSLQFVQ